MNSPTWFVTLEHILKLAEGLFGLATLGYAIFHMLRAQNRPSGTTTGAATRVLRTPYLVIATIVFIIGVYLLWQSLPLALPWRMELILLLAGSAIFIPSLITYIWGLRSLGVNFNASSGFGVRLVQSHQLVTSGPYRYIRHPMYLAVILAGWGALLIYLTWAMLVFALMMHGLIIRARREEGALALEFGEAWNAYRQRVPGWIPRINKFT